MTLLRAGRLRFALPRGVIRSARRLTAAAVVERDGRYLANLGDRLVPFVPLAQLFGETPAGVQFLLEGEAAGQSLAVAVDAVSRRGGGPDPSAHDQGSDHGPPRRRSAALRRRAGRGALAVGPGACARPSGWRRSPPAARAASRARAAGRRLAGHPRDGAPAARGRRLRRRGRRRCRRGAGPPVGGAFDCVVTDIEMPGMDGFELTRPPAQHAAPVAAPRRRRLDPRAPRGPTAAASRPAPTPTSPSRRSTPPSWSAWCAGSEGVDARPGQVRVLLVDDSSTVRAVLRRLFARDRRHRGRRRGRGRRTGGPGGARASAPTSCSWTSRCPSSTATRRRSGSWRCARRRSWSSPRGPIATRCTPRSRRCARGALDVLAEAGGYRRLGAAARSVSRRPSGAWPPRRRAGRRARGGAGTSRTPAATGPIGPGHSESRSLQAVRYVAVGASTGGPTAVRDLLAALPVPIAGAGASGPAHRRRLRGGPGRVAGQRAPPRRSGGRDGERPAPMRFASRPPAPTCACGGDGILHLDATAPPRNGHRPSADELFLSCASLVSDRDRRRASHRHGHRWRDGAGGAAAGRRTDDGPGRGHLGGVRHAAGGPGERRGRARVVAARARADPGRILVEGADVKTTRVLVVDDSAITRALLARTLQRAGFSRHRGAGRRRGRSRRPA